MPRFFMTRDGDPNTPGVVWTSKPGFWIARSDTKILVEFEYTVADTQLPNEWSYRDYQT